MSVFPHLLACAPVFAFSGLLIFFNSKQSPRREQLSLSEVGILQPALEPGFLEKLDRGDRSGGCSWGPRDSFPHSHEGPQLEEGSVPTHALLRAGRCFWDPPAIILCGPSPHSRALQAAPAGFASSERPVPCPGSGPKQPEHSRGRHGHNGLEQQLEGFLLVFSGSLFLSKVPL